MTTSSTRSARSPTTTTVAEANDRANDDLPSATAFVWHFGTWNASVEAASLDSRDRRRSDTELLADLQAFAEDRGEHPTYDAVAACEGMATPQTYEYRFGSWNAALRKAGLPAFAATTTGDNGDNGGGKRDH